MANPIRYSSRDFDSILADLNRDQELVDKPAWFKRAIAGIGDVISMWLDAEANNSALRTAFTRQAVADLCELIDYELASQVPSSVEVLFHLKDGVSFPLTFAASDLAAATRGTVASNPKRFESRETATVTAASDSVDLDANPPSGSTLLVSRDFTTGERVFLRGNAPTGLSLNVAYYAIRVDATHVRLASSAALAYAGTYLTCSGGSGTMTLDVYSFKATCYQQETKDAYVAGVGDGSTEFLELDLSDKYVVRDTLTVTINGEAWTRVDSLALSGPSDRHYQHVYNNDMSSFVRFGDGTCGAVPEAFDVYVAYAVGGGSDGNVARGGITSYAGTRDELNGATNPAAATGGADPEGMEKAKRIAPGKLKSRDRFVTEGDGEALVLAYGGTSLVRVLPNEYGQLSAKVVCVASGGGNLTPEVRAALQEYLISKTVLEAMDVRVEPAVITAVDVTSAAQMLPGYLWADVLPYFRLGWKLFLSEAGQEVIDAYVDHGDSYVTTMINSIFGESFDDADPKAVRLVVALQTYGARGFGETLQESDAVALIQGNVAGIDYMTVSAPAFPLALDPDEIVTPGSLTLSEV